MSSTNLDFNLSNIPKESNFSFRNIKGLIGCTSDLKLDDNPINTYYRRVELFLGK
jgi:hypothetical protein